MRVVTDLLDNRGGSYILPFLWMHGEPHAVLLEELDRIASCGIREVCLESRPHPDFCGPGWWRDLDVIMAEARRRRMRVWVLDDDKFPTGHANGAFEVIHPELAKWYLAERHIDVRGPAEDLSLLIAPFLGADGRLLGVLACPRTGPDTAALAGAGCIDLSGRVCDGFVALDLPAGDWRIFVLFTTQAGGGRSAWMNLLDHRSVRVLVDAVYEPHWERYHADFGKTFAGFFSDEPEIGNLPGYDFHATLGRADVRLPWSDQLEERLRTCWGSLFLQHLPALWYDMGTGTPAIRTAFMDAVTRLVASCLAGQIGAWCTAHGVEHIGHVIEDDNAHARLGCSIGHYFRQQRGQHMAGVDVVHVQIAPGMHGQVYRSIAGDGDGEFFHFGLAKLASSQAALDPHKQGRALCELFGNYGWALGVPMMKWLTDHMLVRGINRFVPHAFSPLFPDRDCPPHFYARGRNATFPFFQALMRYMNRCGHLMSGGVRRADCAVLYHAEAEWAGRAMPFQKPVRALLEAQLDCDVVPADLLAAVAPQDAMETGGTERTDPEAGPDAPRFAEDRLQVNGRSYGCLIIPCCERMPESVARFVEQVAGSGFAVCVVDALPVSGTNGAPLSAAFHRKAAVVPLKELAAWVRSRQQPDATLTGSWPDLRLLRLERADGMVLMCFNESPDRRVETRVACKQLQAGALYRYDAQENVACAVPVAHGGFPLVLEPGESRFYLLSRDPASWDSLAGGRRALPVEGEGRRCDELVMDLAWTVSTAEPAWTASAAEPALEPVFRQRWVFRPGEPLPNLNGPGYLPRFSGWFRYEASFLLSVQPGTRYCIRFPRISDCARLEINGHDAGMLLGSPFRREVTDLVASGENRITVIGCNTLVWQLRDGASTHLPVQPTGITRPPLLESWPPA